MRITHAARRWVLLGLLGCTAVVSGFLLLIQIVLALFAGPGSWQLPRISRVTVERVEKDPNNQFSDNLIVTQGETERELQMLKEEMRELRRHEEIWILDNFRVTPLRPAHFRLTPLRIFLEFPLPFLLLSLWGIQGLDRRERERRKAVQDDPGRARTALRDDFHLRAERFAPGLREAEKRDGVPPAGGE